MKIRSDGNYYGATERLEEFAGRKQLRRKHGKRYKSKVQKQQITQLKNVTIKRRVIHNLIK